MFRIQKCAMFMGASVVEYKRGISNALMITNKQRSAVGSNVSKQNNSFNSTCMKSKINSSSRRAQSTGNNVPTVPLAAVNTAASKDESREFMAVFPDVVRDLTDAGKHLDIPEATKWFAKVLQYNVPGGKKNRGLATVFAYRMLSPADQLTPENLRLAHIIGWCVEMLQAFFLVVDDVMDNATTRRGRPCWYRHKDIGVAAVNDGILLEKFGRKPNLDNFTMTRYTAIVKYKTAYYSFYLPVALAMHMAGFQDEEMHRQAKTILLEMGHFFQVQDDFLDCFGDPEITGKIGTDIQDGKCSWLVVVALQRVTPEQRAILEECYGSKNPEHVAAVKELYKLIGLPATYYIYEEENYKLISTHIQQMSRGMPHKLFFNFLEKIYRRER
ncbi:Farnesyl pyrophosphate synthase [Gryllus bimaculatus]|nr:Farnesyl pyrophosphate synthase [Gryllus bimaculatus]